jgi:endoglucanase
MNSVKYIKLTALIISAWITCMVSAASERECLIINDSGYFDMGGLNVMVYDDTYPEGHQGGITIIQNGIRVAANGDLRLETAPGQWQPLPRTEKKVIDTAGNSVTVTLYFPDEERSKEYFSPLPSPDINLRYHVKVKAECESVRITIDLDEPLPERWIGKVGFNLELFPGVLFDNAYYMDDIAGFFPRQLNGPLIRDAEGMLHAEPLAEGRSLIIAPESADHRMTITAVTGKLRLLDGRTQHNNGWFIIRTNVPAGATRNAVEWVITPGVVAGWTYDPVIHNSQVGYHPLQSKVAVIECDKSHVISQKAYLRRIMPDGEKKTVFEGFPEMWGEFLRYQYLRFDFSAVMQSGLYILEYENSVSEIFRIDSSIFDRHVWQPTIEYFLPVQMCHMRINDRYRVWHGLCHMDDALMAPADTIHIDGYFQGDSALTRFSPYEHVPGLNAGGWHDAGDYDLRVESQSGTVHILSLIYEEFGIDYDVTSIDQRNHLVELHVPDGKPDVLQQIEHGVISILGGYKNLGRLYRGIISSTTRQYVLLGDGANMTDNDISSSADNRWVFTEINPRRELYVSGCLAAASRVLKGYNDSLSLQCLQVAEELWRKNSGEDRYVRFAAEALAELILSTNKQDYKEQMLAISAKIPMSASGWSVSRVVPVIDDKQFSTMVNDSLRNYVAKVRNELDDSPFGVLYRPRIWGAGWQIQSLGVRQYYLYRYTHDDACKEYMLNTLNFVLGCHPGENTASFVSGVGTNSAIVAYGVNRADWSYIPGGVISGTALIRPDFPELKVWPYLWQQTEYVMGGGATKFMFLVLAARRILEKE